MNFLFFAFFSIFYPLLLYIIQRNLRLIYDTEARVYSILCVFLCKMGSKGTKWTAKTPDFASLQVSSCKIGIFSQICHKKYQPTKETGSKTPFFWSKWQVFALKSGHFASIRQSYSRGLSLLCAHYIKFVLNNKLYLGGLPLVKE